MQIVLTDSMPGVRDGLRWLLSAIADVEIVAEAATVAEALRAPGELVIAGVHFADGTAADLVARSARPVVVWTFLPPDERPGIDLSGAAAVVPAGSLAACLPRVLSELSARNGW